LTTTLGVLSNASVTTGAGGAVTTTLTAGVTPGTATVTATVGRMARRVQVAFRPIPPAAVTVSGPITGSVDTAYTFTATIAPLWATRPITYTWQATGQAPVTHSSGLTDTVAFTWHVSGTQTITVTAINAGGAVTGTHTIGIGITETEWAIPLQPGWNLIALPLAPAAPAPAAVLASIAGSYDLVYGYEACDASDPWKRFDPAAPAQVNDLTAMDVRHGYWLRAIQAVELTMRGAPPASTAIALCTGWNLVGYPAPAAIALPAALAGIAGKYDLVYTYIAGDPDPWKRFDPIAPPQVNDLTAMGPARGYWIRATAPAVLNVP